MAIGGGDNAVPNDDFNSSMKIPSEYDLLTLILEKKFRYRRLEEILVGLQNRTAFASEDELPELQNKGSLIRIGLNNYIEELRTYREMYQEHYAGK